MLVTTRADIKAGLTPTERLIFRQESTIVNRLVGRHLLDQGQITPLEGATQRGTFTNEGVAQTLRS